MGDLRERPAFKVERIDSDKEPYVRMPRKFVDALTDRIAALEDEVDRLKRELGA